MARVRRAQTGARTLGPNRALRQELRRIRVRAAAGMSPRARQRSRALCYALCGACGYLQSVPAPDTFRVEPTQAASIRDACPHCGALAWHDLNDEDTALALRDAETRVRRHHHALARRGAGALASLAGVALAVPLGVLLHQLVGVTLVNAALIAFLIPAILATWLFNHLIPKRHARLRDAGVYDTFTRWREPLPRSLVAATADAEPGAFAAVDSDHELLLAPWSGTPCVGYEVRLYRDASEQSPVCVLREQRCLEFHHGELEIPGEAVSLALPLRRVPRRGPGAPDQRALARTLRQRGLYLADGPYLLEEAIVVPGERYELVPVDAEGSRAYVLRYGPLALAERAVSAGPEGARA
ncbi:MAG: hypothetical protein KC468_35120 [Myxococcales bacterium]|nr:hypothetical protein [Myxococcales bacterium]